MFQKIYQKLQTREGLTLIVSIAIIVGVVGFIIGGFHRGDREMGNAQGQVPSITVTGQGEVFAVPDVAQFTFSIEKTAPTMAAAQKLATDQGNALVQKLKDEGIDKKDIKTEGFNAYPKYENKAVSSLIRPCGPQSCPPEAVNSVITGYTVNQSYSVKVRNLDKSGDIAKLITDNNVSSVNGPDFTIDDMTAVTNGARDKAIADAKEQAEILARQLGVHLRKIVDFQVVNGGVVAPYAMRATASADMVGAKEAAPTIEPGQSDIKVQVNITYRIQ